jgi:hypothetical protein
VLASSKRPYAKNGLGAQVCDPRGYAPPGPTSAAGSGSPIVNVGRVDLTRLGAAPLGAQAPAVRAYAELVHGLRGILCCNLESCDVYRVLYVLCQLAVGRGAVGKEEFLVFFGVVCVCASVCCGKLPLICQEVGCV